MLIALNKSDATAANRSPGRDGRTARVALPATPPDRPITDRLEVVPFRRIDAAVLMPFGSLLGLQSSSSRRQSHVQELFAGLIRSLTAAIDAKDSYTCGHSERVARIAVELGRELELSDVELGDIYLGGLLHDVGKIGVPDSILCKCGPLTAEEFMQIRQHVLIGCRILGDFREISHLLPLVLSHHERYDGMGYPHGLSGEAIPLLARVLAVADCYDAMNTSGLIELRWFAIGSRKSLEEGRNRQWDGKVVERLLPRPRTDLLRPPAWCRGFRLVRPQLRRRTVFTGIIQPIAWTDELVIPSKAEIARRIEPIQSPPGSP